MKFTFNWKIGIISAFGTVLLGGALFLFVGAPIDSACQNTSTVSAGCRVYQGYNTVVQGYSDFWRQFFAPDCVGGKSSDDCLGPDFGIMFWTLAFSGMIVGGTSKKKPAAKK